MTTLEVKLPTLEQVAQFSTDYISYLEVTGTQPDTDYEYTCKTVFEHFNGRYIKLSTEERRNFLKKGTESEARASLIGLAKHVQAMSGGVFNIHPFYGAVCGSKENTVAPGFMKDIEHADADLSMIIYPTDLGQEFDDESTKETLASSISVIGGRPQPEKLHIYYETHTFNPNQQNRDEAVMHGLGDKWDAEFANFNRIRRFGKRLVPKAMELTPGNMVQLIQNLGAQGLLENITVTKAE